MGRGSTDKKWLEKQKRKSSRTIFRGSQELSWRKKKATFKPLKEEALLKQMRIKKESDESAKIISAQNSFHDEKHSLSIALPGSILNNAQSPELRTYLAGQIARAAAIFCVDEIVIFDETARMKPQQRESYYANSWYGDLPVREDNVECNFHLAKILEFMECPQYLRKNLFPLQKTLKYAGVLNPLDCTHHLRATDLTIPYREGVILDKPVKQGRGPLCDVGLTKDLRIDKEIALPPGTRVTVKVFDFNTESRNFSGCLTSPRRIRSESGLYWGYNLRIALSLHDVLNGNEYDIIIGTSEKGKPVSDLQLPLTEKKRVLIVFGGLDGLEAAVEADESIESHDPSTLFEHYINTVPEQGTRTIRTEEAILITLAVLKPKFDVEL